MKPLLLLLAGGALLALASCRHNDPYAGYGRGPGSAPGQPRAQQPPPPPQRAPAYGNNRERKAYERGYRDGAEQAEQDPAHAHAQLPPRRPFGNSSVNVGVGYGGGRGRWGGWGGGFGVNTQFPFGRRHFGW